ncbi:MAG: hypothetical protein JJLCMIEE_00671 [Acidimicrobiales bacterium]|nr:MAG: rod shape-determining protein MreC [Actinomycetota bacterium]MBV6507621.1 hypothetical protein [Acidimicrobiales bacterium]RIK07554.1 MAG: rod shape-determining protein MreC [Acidobacteriota bacterium]
MQMASPGRTGRSRYTLIVLVLVSITVVTLDFRGVAVLDGARDAAMTVIDPVQSALGSVFEPVSNTWNGIFEYDDVVAENEQLRDELDELKGEALEEESAQEQLELLTDQLDIEFTAEYETAVARVVSGSLANFDEYSIHIDKGSSDGIEEGMPVVTGAGLLGRVVDVSRTRSVVQLITDPSSNVGVRLGASQDLGVGHGTGRDGPFVIDTGIELDTSIAEGEPVVTSGLDRGLYPPGLPVGKVASAASSDAERIQVVDVDYSVAFNRLDFVHVVLWTPEEQD